MIFDIDIQKMLLTFQFLFLLICVTPKEYITQKGCAECSKTVYIDQSFLTIYTCIKNNVACIILFNKEF